MYEVIGQGSALSFDMPGQGNYLVSLRYEIRIFHEINSIQAAKPL